MTCVAVIGSGIAGLAAARALVPHAAVSLFEAADYFGGHTHTVDAEVDGCRFGVDTGFLVFNERTYPALIGLFAELGVATAPAEMSFSVQAPSAGLEWSGTDMNGVFAQRRNVVRPAFWTMLAEILRFNRLTSALAAAPPEAHAAELDASISDFLDRHRFSTLFREGYFLPMIGCIWSCPTEQMLRFPIATMIRFCHNHGLLQISNRPQWHTVRGGARSYVAKMLESIPEACCRQPARRITRTRSGPVEVGFDGGTRSFDAVVLACHSDQALALLAAPSADEQAVLGAIRYHANRAVLHTDTRLLPRRRRAWAAWNYERSADASAERAAVCLHYLINRLQPLPVATPVIVSLNAARPPDPRQVQGTFDYAHPVFDRAAIAAQRRLPDLQGRGGIWYCGAWAGFGFHEDGLVSGLAAAAGVVRHLESGAATSVAERAWTANAA